MKAFKIIGIIILVMIIGFFIGAFFLPKQVDVERKIVIKAPIERVFTAVNNFHIWSKWSMWTDSAMSTKFDGPESGIGAKMIWSDKKEGMGEMSIIESIPNEKITTQLTFKNTESSTKSSFSFKAVEGGVEVSWSIHSEGYGYPFGHYAAWMLTKGLNNSFAKSLDRMKKLVESDYVYPVSGSAYVVEVIAFEGKSYIAYSDSGTADECSKKMAADYTLLYSFLAKNKVESEGFPICIWFNFDPKGSSHFSCALPRSKKVKGENNIKAIKIEPTKVAFVKHIGSYESSYNAWMTLESYMKENKLEMNGNPWEEYEIGPTQESDSTKFVTNIYYPVK